LKALKNKIFVSITIVHEVMLISTCWDHITQVQRPNHYTTNQKNYCMLSYYFRFKFLLISDIQGGPKNWHTFLYILTSYASSHRVHQILIDFQT